jgi:DNA-binding MarR family transcriptional regulator
MTPNEIRAIVGLPSEAGGENIPDPTSAPTAFKFSEDDIISIFAEYGTSKDEFSIFKSREVFGQAPSDLEENLNLEFAIGELTQLEANVLDLISKDKRITPEVIAGTIRIDIAIVKSILENLKSKGLITSSIVKGDTVRILNQPLADLEAPKAQTKSFTIRYSYEWRSSIPSGQRDTAAHPSREFCARLMDLNKLYSRAEIEAISSRLGYSVFDRRGGWWTKPDGVHSPSCRHIWKSQTVIKKG